MLLGLYRTATRLGGPLIEAHLRRRADQAREDPARLGERFGRPGLERPAEPLLWLHAASLGEASSALPLLEALMATRRRLEILLTTGTVSSARLLAERLPARMRHQFAPVDRPGAWRAFLAHWRPDLALLVESELWPNLILEARARGVPLALINGRMSERSFRRWTRVRGSAARLLDGFELFLAQSEADRARFVALGAPRVAWLGNLKLAAPPLPAEPATLAALRESIGDRPVWLAASTHPGEEAQVLAVHAGIARELPDLLTMIAPRHAERGAELAALIRGRGLPLARRSAAEPPGRACAVYLADTFGELGLLYRVAQVALIGGSIVPHGGQNPLEAAKLGCPLLFGPHTDNFAEIAAALEQAEAARRVADTADLERQIAALLADPPARARMAGRARDVVAQGAEVLAATVAALAPMLDRALGPADAPP